MQRRTNLLWGVVLLAAALVIVLRAFGVVPDGIYDLVARAWPALLVFGGLALFLRGRIPAGALAALLISGALVAGVTVFAFSTRATQERDDYRQAVNQPVGAGVTLLRVQVDMLNTDVELVRALEERLVIGQFVGSTESLVWTEYAEAGDGTATLAVRETQPNPYPLLEAVGRGRLRLELPPELALDIDFNGADGDASLTLSGLAVERLNMNLRRGDALVTLPDYKPLGSPEDAVLGVLAVRDGDLTVFVPDTVAARLELSGASGIPPLYDAAAYNLLANGVLEARNYDTFDIKLRYVLEVPGGQILLQSAD